MRKSLLYNLRFVFSVARRFSVADRTSRASLTSRLGMVGICFGVMTLIVVMSVMNGFQMSFIDAIQEISSYHIQVENFEGDESLLLSERGVKSITPFYQAQTLICSVPGSASGSSAVFESPAIIRGIPAETFYEDDGFRREMTLLSGSFDLSGGGIVLGNQLASSLHVRTGDKINLFVLSGSSDVELFSAERVFTVTGIFASGYQEINSGLCFVNLEDAARQFGKAAGRIIGIKVSRMNDVERVMRSLEKRFFGKNTVIRSWKEYNKSFYGALRIEKNMLLLVVCLIFVVVAINIYNAMRRLVFERQRELAILSALGARTGAIQGIFISRGLYTGLLGSLAGLFLGLLISANSNAVFNAASKLVYCLQYAFTALFDHQSLPYVTENSSYAIYANIPARIFRGEVVMIFLFGSLSPLFACFFASRNVLRLNLSEVLHDE